MEAAKNAVNSHLASGGRDTTSHHEAVAPSVVHEQVKPSQHEELTTATQRETHQDHYHTTVQPINHSETLPEIHKHNLAEVQHVHKNHDDADLNLRRLQDEKAKYKDEQTVHNTTHSRSVAPAVQSDRVHHHVHEIVQPVVHKQTYQPETVHTTVPIHEVHHNAAQHHDAAVMPAMSMNDYKKSGRTLHGRDEERVEHFDGQPKDVSALSPVFGHGGREHKSNVPTSDRDAHVGGHRHNDDLAGSAPALGNTHNVIGSNTHGAHDPTTGGLGGSGSALGATHGTNGRHAHGARDEPSTLNGGPYNTHSNGTPSGIAQNGAGVPSVGHSAGDKPGLPGVGDTAAPVAPISHDRTYKTDSIASHDSTSSKKKPSLMDKLNPKIDADGDGKAGFMS